MQKNKLQTHLLLDEKYLLELLSAVIPQPISKINIYPVKVYLKPDVEHVVIACQVILKTGKHLALFAMGHSSGIKKKLYQILKFLRQYFKDGKWQVPEPLLYDAKTKALVYEELSGPNLYALFEKEEEDLLTLFKSFGQWIAALHAISPSEIFKPHDIGMEELDPANIMHEIKKKDPELHNVISDLIRRMTGLRKTILPGHRARYLVHGDLHPENVILLSGLKNPKLGLIDVENACLSDREQDLGSFLEQVEIMAGPHYEHSTVKKFEKEFLDAYLRAAKLDMDQDMKNKILFYESFFGLKGAIFYFRLGWFDKMKKILARVEQRVTQLEDKL